MQYSVTPNYLTEDNLSDRLFIYCTYLLSFSISLSKVASTGPMVVFAICWVLMLINKRFRGAASGQDIVLLGLMIATALMYFISYFYSDDKANALQGLKAKIPMLLCPIMLFVVPVFSKKHLAYIANAFILGCWVNVIVGLVRSFIHYNDTGNWLYYTDLLSAGQLHPAYFGMFLNFAMAIMVFRLIRNNFSLRHKLNWFYLISIIAFLGFEVLIRARMQIILLFVLINFVIITTKNIPKIHTRLLYAFLLNLVVAVFVFSNDDLRTRFSYLRNLDYSFDQKAKWNGASIRLAQWKCSVKVISQAPLTGYGIGDARQVLTDEYQRKGFMLAYEKRYNAHNQYLQTALIAGIPALLIQLLVLGVLLMICLEKRSMILGVFLLLTSLSWLPESMLQSQSGIVFYAFFSALLGFHLSRSD